MLNDQHRKRARQALAAVARAPPTTRRPNALPPAQTGRSADSRILAALPRFSDAQPPPHYPRQQQPLWTRRSAVASVDLPTTAAAESAGGAAALVALRPALATDHVDVRKLIRHAHRAHKLLLDRLTVVNMRRNHRCELANEIARLKRVLAALQTQVDTTSRNVAAMDRLVQHLQQISSIFHDDVSEQRCPEQASSAGNGALAQAADAALTPARSSADATASTTTCRSTSRLERTESSCSSDVFESTARAPSQTDSQDLPCEGETSPSGDADAVRAE